MSAENTSLTPWSDAIGGATAGTAIQPRFGAQGSEVSPYGPGDYVDASGYVEIGEEVAVSPASAEQGIIFVADGSVSMEDPVEEPGGDIPGMAALTRPKHVAASVAMSDTVELLKVSRKNANFWLSFIAYHERVSINRPLRPVLDIPATDDFDPTAAGTGGTCLFAGLDAAYEQIVEFRRNRSGTLHVSNVVLAFTDGLCSDPARTLAAAARLKEMDNVKVAACLFAAKGKADQADAGARLLQQVASGPKFYKTVFSAAQIREFFLASISLAG